MRAKREIIISEDDKQLKFVVEAMPATKGFLFGARLAQLCLRGLSDIKSGNKLEAWSSFLNRLTMDEMTEVMDGLLSCVTYNSGVTIQVCTREALDQILSDPANVFTLLTASLDVNANFIVRHIPEDIQKNLRGAMDLTGLTSALSTEAKKSSQS